MKILMHMCCGPCACYPTQRLRDEGFEPAGYFFNPNIHPWREWKQRLRTARQFATEVGIEFAADNHYRLREFLSRVWSLIDEADTIQHADGFHKRCAVCYSWRLQEAARYASEHGFELWTSTLFYSKHQNHELMKKIAEHFAKVFGVNFYYEDFRAGWQEGIDLSVSFGLYRQNYCGCVFSEEERFSQDVRKARKRFFSNGY